MMNRAKLILTLLQLHIITYYKLSIDTICSVRACLRGDYILKFLFFWKTFPDEVDTKKCF